MNINKELINNISEKFGIVAIDDDTIIIIEQEDDQEIIICKNKEDSIFKIPLIEYNFFKKKEIGLSDYLNFTNSDFILGIYGGHLEIFHDLLKDFKISEELKLYMKLNGE